MVFYFTGTGNSLYAAKMLEDEIVSIPQIIHRDSLVFKADKIGVVCPVYGHEMPEMVKEFVKRAVFHTEYLYVVLTYGAKHGNAVELAQEVLDNCGKKAAYIGTLLMVDNFLPVFDMTEEMKQDKQVEQQIAKIKAEITMKKHSVERVTAKDRALHRMYALSVRHAPAAVWTDFTVTEECVGCGICTKVCPVGCIRLENQKAVFTKENCQACFACIHACPKRAIGLNRPEKNAASRYRNEHVSLCELVAANNQTEN